MNQNWQKKIMKDVFTWVASLKLLKTNCHILIRFIGPCTLRAHYAHYASWKGAKSNHKDRPFKLFDRPVRIKCAHNLQWLCTQGACAKSALSFHIVCNDSASQSVHSYHQQIKVSLFSFNEFSSSSIFQFFNFVFITHTIRKHNSHKHGANGFICNGVSNDIAQTSLFKYVLTIVPQMFWIIVAVALEFCAGSDCGPRSRLQITKPTCTNQRVIIVMKASPHVSSVVYKMRLSERSSLGTSVLGFSSWATFTFLGCASLWTLPPFKII
jgi:hypothetical protein